MSNNLDRVLKAQRIVQQALPVFIERQMKRIYPHDWWKMVQNTMEQRVSLPDTGDAKVLASKLDLAQLVYLMDRFWSTCYRDDLDRNARTYLNEIRDIRNAAAHVKGDDHSLADAYRALDTMVRFLEPVDKTRAAEVNEIFGEVKQELFQASAPTPVPAPKPASAALPGTEPVQIAKAPAPAPAPVSAPGTASRPWRDVVEPHEDVRTGSFQKAQFAADLADVLAKQAEDDYQDPARFFARTFITAGMRHLLATGLKRIAGTGGDPIIQLKTAFGGGKTHTMIALYHLLQSGARSGSLPGVQSVLDEAGVEASAIPAAKVAVLVGTDLDPNEARFDAAGRGVTVRTLWGELAAQIGGADAYDMVRASDESGVPPGADKLLSMLEDFGPVVILIDEFVAYARKLYGRDHLPSGTFEANLSFVQELTQAVRRAGNALLVLSLPESEKEFGGEAGRTVQERLEDLAAGEAAQISQGRLEHVVGRMDTIWRPVQAEEGFEVVRRRLFGEVTDTTARDLVCAEFARQYRKAGTDFPTDTQTSDYEKRMQRSYPFHPEIFDRLYNEWSALPEFQRTRGVLKLMAAVVFVLWERGHADRLIMPGDMPFDHPAIRSEIQRYLPEAFSAVIDHDVLAKPNEIDSSQGRFGKIGAAKRLARTVLLGSAPTGQERVKGIDESRIRLGVVQNQSEVSVYNDALHKMADDFTYLFTENHRYWYDTRANLNRTAEDRARTIQPHEIREEIRRRLAAERGRGIFAGVHVFADAGDVPDGGEVRLVILPPDFTHRNTPSETNALGRAKSILDSRGNGPRNARNTLVFLAADQTSNESLESTVRQYLAWTGIIADKDVLNLDQSSIKQAENNRERMDSAVNTGIRDTFVWLLTPSQDPETFKTTWNADRVPAGAVTAAERVSNAVAKSEQVIAKWSARPIRQVLEQFFWKDGAESVEVSRVWEALVNYCYMPRLANQQVFIDAISAGMPFPDFFGYAAGKGADGRYEGLVFNKALAPSQIVVGQGSLLVHPDAAFRQIEADREAERLRREQGGDTPHPDGGSEQEDGGGTVTPPLPPPPMVDRLPTRFFASKTVDNARMTRELGDIVTEIVHHLTTLTGAEVDVSIEIKATVPDGISQDTQRVVLENMRTLKVAGDFS
jgi:predicted AAA+ superfamily ATPase